MAAVVHGGMGSLAKQIEIRSHRLIVDEDVAAGGADAGPDPHELLDAALASCTALTLHLYAARKGWPIEDVRVEVTHDGTGAAYEFKRRILIGGNLGEGERQRLLQIAEKCPIHKVLSGQIRITTQIG